MRVVPIAAVDDLRDHRPVRRPHRDRRLIVGGSRRSGIERRKTPISRNRPHDRPSSSPGRRPTGPDHVEIDVLLPDGRNTTARGGRIVRPPARDAMPAAIGVERRNRATTGAEVAIASQGKVNGSEEDEARRMGQTPITAEKRAIPDRLVVAIDGPAASGKTTVGSAVAERLGGLFFDTGVVYRALTLAAIEHQVEPSAALRLAGLARRMQLDVRPPSQADGRLYDVWLEGVDVTWAIRAAAVDRTVSEVSSHPIVRKELLGLQRRIAHGGRVVMVGRDIGTVIVPNADVKVWLDAGLEERARRRQRELAERGVDRSAEELARELAARDAGDARKEMGAMRRAEDAVAIDTTGMSVEDVVSKIVELVLARARVQDVSDA